MKMSLENEASRASKLLKNKIIDKIYRHRKTEVVIFFTDGTRFFIDQSEEGLELSITDDKKSEEPHEK